MATVYMAPDQTPWSGDLTLFLAGSIDMGNAIDWQTDLSNRLADLPIDIYNPRRSDWDASWVQSIDNPKFKEQVEWELQHLEIADMAVFVFDPKGPAPITLLELGLFASKDIYVFCPEGYWRKGNVDIVCERYGIPQAESMEELAAMIRERVYQDD